MSSSLVSSFLGALQASLSVLLVIGYGVLACQWGFLDKPTGKKISTVCVKMFLPALLITKVGKELHLDTGLRYVPILIWAISYNVVSVLIGLALVKLFKFPSWITPAVAFNNTTSLPLLLIQSLQSTGILERLLLDGDTDSAAIDRAQSYFLVNAVIGNCLTFALGPRLIDAEHAPDEAEDGNKKIDQQHQENGHENGDVEQGQDNANEETSLLPDRVQNAEEVSEQAIFNFGKTRWNKLSPRAQELLSLLYDFANAPLIGAVIGAIIGLTPPLHKAFFADSFNGGFFTAWLTSSLQNIGQLFVSLQVVVVGVSLSSSLRKMKRGEDSGKVPWLPATVVLLIRFFIWPAISIGIIYGLAKHTHALDKDPVLWFAMMLMPAGPPAMKLIAMADVNGAEEAEKMTIAKLLTVSYVLSPILALSVVACLHASEAAMK